MSTTPSSTEAQAKEPVRKPTHEEQVAAAFVRDVAKHELTVKHDDGLYRHLLFKEPGRSACWFELIMWPGALTISGDMGTYTFRRELDMIPWFLNGSSEINPGYWSQKLQNADGVREYDADLAKEMVDQEVDEWAEDLTDEQAAFLRDAVAGDVLRFLEDEHTFRENLNSFSETVDGHRYGFEDTWDWSLRRYTHHFLWACHAIRWGLTKHREHHATLEAAAAAKAPKNRQPFVRPDNACPAEHPIFKGMLCGLLPHGETTHDNGTGWEWA